MKKLILIILLVNITTVGFSQSTNSFLNEIPFNTSLTDEQQSELNKITDNPLLLNHHLITIADLETYSESTDDGIIEVSLPFLPETDIQFIASRVKYDDDNNYYWTGINNMDYEEEDFEHSTFSLTRFEGTFAGNIVFNHQSFEIHDLSGGIICISELDMSGMGPDECTLLEDGPTANKTTNGPCGTEDTRVLVIFGVDAQSVNGNIPALAQAGINELNHIWSVSDIQNTATVTTQFVPFSRTTDINNDINNLSADATIQAWRNIHQADIVIIMVGQPYGGIFGGARLAPAAADAYGIVSATTAVGGRRTFAHEISHIYGADHDDVANTNARGRNFRAGLLGLGKRHYTLMAKLPPNETRITHLSNPDVKFTSRKTGTSNRNNTAETIGMINTVADHRPNPAFFLNATVNWGTITSCTDQTTAIVTPVCGEPPYSYQWQSTTDGINWVNGSTTDQEQIVIPSSNGPYSYVQYRVLVSDADVNNPNTPIVRSQAWNVLCHGLPHRPAGNLTQEAKEVAIYPNPTNGNFKLSLSDDFIGQLKVKFIDITGRVVYSKEITATINLVEIDDLSSLAKSTYTVKITNQNNISKSLKVVIE